MKMKFAKSILLLSLTTALVSCGGDAAKEANEEDKNTATENTSDNHSTDSATAPIVAGGLKIAYVNSDTLTLHYDYNKALVVELQAKESEAEYKLKAMENAFLEKRKYLEANQTMMGESEIIRLSNELVQMQEDYYKKTEELSLKFQENNYYASIDYKEKTSQYMQVIGKQLGYDFILSYRTGDVVMYADEKFDITYQMIDLLNEEYNKERTGE